jgi:hypothetical protein
MIQVLAGVAITLLAVLIIPLLMGYVFVKLSTNIVRHIVREVLKEMPQPPTKAPTQGGGPKQPDHPRAGWPKFKPGDSVMRGAHKFVVDSVHQDQTYSLRHPWASAPLTTPFFEDELKPAS